MPVSLSISKSGNSSTQSSDQRAGRLGREQADEGEAQRAEHLGGDERLVGGEDDEVAGLAADLLDERGLLGLAEELDDGAAQGAALLDVHVGHALGAVLLGELGELVDLGPAEGTAAGRPDGAHHAAAVDGAAEDLELARRRTSR